MDKMRSKLEDLKELRDLVRSLGRGGGWGPLRRSPIQYLDMKVLTNCHSVPLCPSWALRTLPNHHQGVGVAVSTAACPVQNASDAMCSVTRACALCMLATQNCVLKSMHPCSAQFWDESWVRCHVLVNEEQLLCDVGEAWPAAHSAGSSGDQGPDAQ